MEQTKPKPFLIQCSGCKTTIKINWPRPVITCRNCGEAIDVDAAKEAYTTMLREKRKQHISFKRRQAKVQKQKESLECDCGNIIQIMSGKHDCKCFKCNFYWVKKNNQWEKTDLQVGRDDMTLAHFCPPALQEKLRIHPNELKPQARTHND